MLTKWLHFYLKFCWALERNLDAWGISKDGASSCCSYCHWFIYDQRLWKLNKNSFESFSSHNPVPFMRGAPWEGHYAMEYSFTGFDTHVKLKKKRNSLQFIHFLKCQKRLMWCVRSLWCNVSFPPTTFVSLYVMFQICLPSLRAHWKDKKSEYLQCNPAPGCARTVETCLGARFKTLRVLLFFRGCCCGLLVVV